MEHFYVKHEYVINYTAFLNKEYFYFKKFAVVFLTTFLFCFKVIMLCYSVLNETVALFQKIISELQTNAGPNNASLYILLYETLYIFVIKNLTINVVFKESREKWLTKTLYF